MVMRTVSRSYSEQDEVQDGYPRGCRDLASGERDDKDTFLALYYQKLKTVLEYNELNWRSIQRGLPC